MNYRNHFKSLKPSGKIFLPEGVDLDQLKMGIKTEKEHTKDDATAAKIALDHLKEDPKYYTKLTSAGLEEDNVAEHCGACEDDMGDGSMPKNGNALDIPHLGQPIHMSKIISIGAGGISQPGGQMASGDLSGYSAVNKGVTKDAGGVPVQPDSEPITAGGKKIDGSIATKSVGGEVVSGEGQKQGGPNSQGTIANTAKMNEGKSKLRSLVKEALKEITFDAKKGKWVRINENTVDMKMGPSYKVVQPTLAHTVDQDKARANQYDPEITEMIDEEELNKMEARINELSNVKRNLSESELDELNKLSDKLEENLGLSAPPSGLNRQTRRDMSKQVAAYDDTADKKSALAGAGAWQSKNNPSWDVTQRKLGSARMARDYVNQLKAAHAAGTLKEDEGEDDFERRQYDRQISKHNRRNSGRFECPTCKTPNALSSWQKKQGYQCDNCADAEEGTGFGGMEEIADSKISVLDDIVKYAMERGFANKPESLAKVVSGVFQKQYGKPADPDAVAEAIKRNSRSMSEASYKVVSPTQLRVNKDDHARTVQCCPDMTESSYKVSQDTLARVNKDDHARTVQTDPEMTEAPVGGMGIPDEKEKKVKRVEPIDLPEPEVSPESEPVDLPEPDELSDIPLDLPDSDAPGETVDGIECPNCGTIKGNKTEEDGRVHCVRCNEPFVPGEVDPDEGDPDAEPTDSDLDSAEKRDRDWIAGLRDPDDLGGDEEFTEVAGGASQHRSFRTVSDLPQKKDARWSDDIDESKEPPKESDTAKKIKKGFKIRKSTKPDQLKHKPVRTTKSGVHKKDK